MSGAPTGWGRRLFGGHLKRIAVKSKGFDARVVFMMLLGVFAAL